MSQGGHNIKSDRNEAIKSDYLSGMSMPEVSVKHGITFQRVHQILIFMGVTRRDPFPAQRLSGPQVHGGGHNGGRRKRVTI